MGGHGREQRTAMEPSSSSKHTTLSDSRELWVPAPPDLPQGCCLGGGQSQGLRGADGRLAMCAHTPAAQQGATPPQAQHIRSEMRPADQLQGARAFVDLGCCVRRENGKHKLKGRALYLYAYTYVRGYTYARRRGRVDLGERLEQTPTLIAVRVPHHMCACHVCARTPTDEIYRTGCYVEKSRKGAAAVLSRPCNMQRFC